MYEQTPSELARRVRTYYRSVLLLDQGKQEYYSAVCSVTGDREGSGGTWLSSRPIEAGLEIDTPSARRSSSRGSLRQFLVYIYQPATQEAYILLCRSNFIVSIAVQCATHHRRNDPLVLYPLSSPSPLGFLFQLFHLATATTPTRVHRLL